MKIELLQYFYEVVTTKSISKVANTSYITQSALSQQLQKLEEEFGTSLLIRSNKGVQLTREGKVVLKYSQFILKNFSNLIEELESLKSGVNSVSIFNNFITSHTLVETVYSLKKLYPMYRFKITCNRVNLAAEKDVSSNELNIYLYYNNLKNHDNNSTFLGFDKLVPVCNVNFDIDTPIKLENLIDKPFLQLNHPIISELFNKSLAKKRLTYKDINLFFTSNSYLDILDGLKNNLGFSLLPLSLVSTKIKEGILKKIDLTENFQFRFECSLSYNSKLLEPIVQIIKNDFTKFLEITS